MFLAFLFLVLVLGVVAGLTQLFARLERIERELDELRYRLSRETQPRAAAPDRPSTPAAAAADAPAPEPVAPIRHPEAVAPVVAPPPPPAPVIPSRPPVAVPPPAIPVAARVAEPPRAPGRSAEELIGGIWLQNVGSVLLLLGVFFLILWGYTTGRFGPGVLVAAGVACGAILAWRGDRLARRVPAFGHALIGVGLGAAYISFYLGHFALGVLTPPATTLLLGGTAILGILVGQHYRVQAIAVLAVLGAFVPQIAAILTGTKGFVDSAPLLLLYLGAIDVVVFALAARSRWPALALLALLLTVGTWMSAIGGRPWDWPVTFGLAALFLGLGLAPIPRLVRDPEPIGGLDAAVVVFAPYAFVAAAWPFLASGGRNEIGLLLLALAAIEAVAGFLVRRVRGESDLWNILVTAAVIFLSAALERLLGRTFTPMSWIVEGVALTAVGVLAGSAWLRTLGGVSAGLGLLLGYPSLFELAGSAAGPALAFDFPWRLFTAASVRTLVMVIALFVGAHLLERERKKLAPGEAEFVPLAWTAVAQLLLLCWLGVHCARLAAEFVPGSGIPGFAELPRGSRDPFSRRETLLLSLASLAWALQAFATIARGYVRGRPLQRAVGYAVGAGAAFAFACAQMMAATGGAWNPADGVFFHLAGIFQIATLGLFLAGAALAGRARDGLAPWERFAPAALTVTLGVLAWMWLATEGGHLASLIGRAGEDRGSAILFSIVACAWTIQAFALLALGVARRIEYRRVLGYAIAATAALAFFLALVSGGGSGPARNVATLFEVATLVLWYAGTALLANRRDALGGHERRAPEVLTVTVNLLTWTWLASFGAHLASEISERVGADPGSVLMFSIVACAWTVQAFVALALGIVQRRPYRRFIGYVVAATAMLAFVVGQASGWNSGTMANLPIRNLAAEFQVMTLLLWLLGAALLARRREALDPSEAKAPETLTLVFNLLLMMWSAQQSALFARVFDTVEARRAAAVVTSGAWVLQALALFLVGWRERSAFLRWLGLGLFGITLAKVALFDLAFVDVFWRFLIAIGFGVVLLGISYVYQRSRLGRAAGS